MNAVDACPKGYKQTELGVIPEDWAVKPLGRCATFRTGPFGSALHKSDYINDGIPIVNPMHIVDGRIEPTQTMTITEQAAKSLSEFCMKVGEIIIGRRGDMGRCAVVQDDQAGYLCGTGSMIIRPHDADTNFLQRILSSPRVISAIEDTSVGTTMINLNQSILAGLKIQFPPLPEQRAIAEALSDVDELLGALDRLIAKKRDIKQAAMQQLLTGQIRLPGFSGEWEAKRFGDLFNFTGGYSASRDQLSKEGYCYLHYGDIHGSTKTHIDTDADFQNIPKLDISLKCISPASLLEDGDVVFVDASEDEAGTSKHVVVINKAKKPFISGLHTIVAKSKTNELAHEYRCYCFQAKAVRQQFLFYAVGTKVSGISKSNISKLTISFPSIPEQTAIAEVLSDMDAELAALEKRREKTRHLKQGMMQELLTGRIRLV
jgi:type I restriction enzyme S subunit